MTATKCEECAKPLKWLKYHQANYQCSNVDCQQPRQPTATAGDLTPYCCHPVDTTIVGYHSVPTDTEE